MCGGIGAGGRAPLASGGARSHLFVNRLPPEPRVPSSIAYRPRSTSEIVDAAFQLLRHDYLQYVMLMALAYMPWVIIATVLGLNEAAAATNPAAFIVSYLVALLWYVLVDAVLVIAASEAYLGRDVNVAAAFRTAFGRLGAVLWAGIIKSLAVGVGLLLLLVPGLYFLAKYFAIPATIVIEGRSGSGGLARSADLSDGLKGHILKTLVLVWIIYIVLAVVATLVAAGLAGALLSSSPSLGAVVLQLVSAAFTILAYPVISVTQTLLYYDARIRKEGYDLELMQQNLGASAPSAASATA